LKLYHNPRCSKSRKTLEITKSASPEIILYLTKHLSRHQLITLVDKLQDPIESLVRWNDSNAPKKPEIIDKASIIDILISHPEIMQRPVIEVGGKAQICRPPEIALSFL
jgi:arsenate reductase